MFGFEGWPSGGPWLITAFGRLTPNESVPGDRLIEVQLSPAPYKDLKPSDIVTVRAPIGALCRLRCGSLWMDGRPVDGEVPSQQQATLETNIPEEPSIVLGGHTVNGEFLIPPFRRRLVEGAATAPYLSLPLEGEPDRMLVPLPEVARTWYLRSTELTNRLMADPLPVALTKMATVDPQPVGQAEKHLTLQSGLGGQDVPIIAMLLLNDFAQKRARLLFDQPAQAHVRGQTRVYLRALPPLAGRVELVARGRWFASAGARRFLVDYFERVPLPALPPIAWNLERDNRALLDGDGNEIHVGEVDDNFGGPRKRAVADEVIVTRHQAPTNRTLKKTADVLMPELAGVPSIVRDPPKGRPTDTFRPTEDETEAQYLGATGEGNWAADGPSPLRLKPERGAEEAAEAATHKPRAILPASFASIKSLRDYVQTQSDWSAQDVPVTQASQNIEGLNCSQFKSALAWCSLAGRPRQLLALQVVYKNFHAYALEIERRETPQGSPEQFSLALVHSLGCKLEAKDFALLLKECAEKKGVWPIQQADQEKSSKSTLHVTRIPHSYRDVVHLALSIMTRIREWEAAPAISSELSQAANDR